MTFQLGTGKTLTFFTVYRLVKMQNQKDGRDLTRVLTHVLLTWDSSWRCFVYIQYYRTSATAGAWFAQKFTAEQLPDQGKRYGSPGKTAWTVHHNTNLAGSLSSSQPGGPPCWVISLAIKQFLKNLHLPRKNFVWECFLFAKTKALILISARVESAMLVG